MAQKKIENKVLTNFNLSFKDFFNQKMLGLGTAQNYLFISRFECKLTKNISSLSDTKKNTFKRQIFKIIPEVSSIVDTSKVAIIFSDLIQSYKGWRHLWGQPVNGQRTWSNAWTSYKYNHILREHKFKIAKFYYGRNYKGDTKVGFLAEHRNLLWKIQWPWEWSYGRAQLLKSLRKNPYKFHIDLLATAIGLLGSLRRDNPKMGKKKKKVLTGSIGFDRGFTRVYARYLINIARRKKRKLRVG